MYLRKYVEINIESMFLVICGHRCPLLTVFLSVWKGHLVSYKLYPHCVYQLLLDIYQHGLISFLFDFLEDVSLEWAGVLYVVQAG